MRATTFVLGAVAALANSVLAQTEGFAVFSAPTDGEVVEAGKPYLIKWAAGKFSGPITLTVIGGPTQPKLQPVEDLATALDVTTNEFKWNVDCSLGDEEVYGLRITLNSDPDTLQYSFPFSINNKGCAASTTSAVSSSTPVASSSVYPVTTPKSSTEVTSTTAASTTETSTTAVTNEPTESTDSAAPTTIITTTLSTTATPTTHASTTASSTTASTSSIATGAATKAAGSFAMAGIAAAAVLVL